MFSYKLIKNKNIVDENFFNKNELGEILNLYGKMVSKGEWKDYAFYINKNLISFDIYRRSSEKPLLQIIKILKGKKEFKYQVKNQHGKIIKNTNQLKSAVSFLQKRNLKLIKIILTVKTNIENILDNLNLDEKLYSVIKF